MVTALWWFCLWGTKMETFGIGVSHTYRLQDGQSLMTPENTHICTHIAYTICLCSWTHLLKHTEDTYCIWITHLMDSWTHQRAVVVTMIQHTKMCLKSTTLYKQAFLSWMFLIIFFCELRKGNASDLDVTEQWILASYRDAKQFVINKNNRICLWTICQHLFLIL